MRTRLADALVNPLIEERSREWAERIAELLRMFSDRVGIQRLLVFPELDDREVIIAVRLHGGDEDRVARFLPRTNRQVAERLFSDIALRWNRIGVRDHVNGTCPAGGRRWWADRAEEAL